MPSPTPASHALSPHSQPQSSLPQHAPPPPGLPQGNLDLSSDPWPQISEEAKDCVRRMLEPRPAKRATADEILQHPWMRENGVATDKPLDNVILKRMT